MATVSRPSSLFTPTTGCTAHLPNAAHEHLDPSTVAELNAWHDDHDAAPTGDDLDALYDQYRVEQGTTDGFFADFIDHIALHFPEVLTWADTF